jgi:hypothetical protein
VVLYGLRLSPHDHWFNWALMPGMFAPAIAAIVVRAWVTGDGFADAGLRPRLRRGWRCYLFALLLAPGLTALIIALTMLFGLAEPHPHFRLGVLSPLVALIIATRCMLNTCGRCCAGWLTGRASRNERIRMGCGIRSPKRRARPGSTW